MNRSTQPDFDQLSQCLSGAARQISLVPNLPAINLEQRLADQFRQFGMQIQNMQTQLLQRLDEHSERFVRLENTITELKENVADLRSEMTLRFEVRSVSISYFFFNRRRRKKLTIFI